MDIKIKKVVAREGLIFAGVLVIAIYCGEWAFLLYLLRFIIWAVKTLKQKSVVI